MISERVGQSRLFSHGFILPHSVRFILILCLAAGLASLGATPAAAAATITVNSGADNGNPSDGLCTLREAITNANADNQLGSADCPAGSGTDTIEFASGYTITLSLGSALPAITSPVTINGHTPGGDVTLQADTGPGTAGYEVLWVNSSGSLTLNDATVRHGGGVLGGGIHNEGALTLNRTTVSQNIDPAGFGGGIYNLGVLAVHDSRIVSNTSDIGFGGGIANSDNGTVTITGSQFVGNNAFLAGGAIFSGQTNADALSVTGSCFTGNSSPAVANPTSGDYLATGNWWGSASGPGSVGPSAYGDMVSDHVDYSGFLTAPILGCGYDPSPRAVLSPSSLVFPGQLVNTTSASKPVTLSNDGTQNLHITQAVTVGAFTLTTNTCSGQTLTPGQTCALAVTFAPTSVGTQTSGLVIFSNGDIPTLVYSLTGMGVTPSPPGISASPSALHFADQLVHTTSDPRTVTLTNNGTQDLLVSQVTTFGAYTVSADTCTGQTVTTGNTCTFGVSFAPLTIGPQPGGVVISSNAQTNPVTLSLTGVGLTPAPPPALKTPKNGAPVYKPPKLSWKSVKGAPGYHVEVLDSMDQVVQFGDVTKAAFPTTLLPFGIYSWHVAIKESFGQGAYSTPLTFEVTLNKSPKKNVQVKSGVVKFSWQAVKGASYLLRINDETAHTVVYQSPSPLNKPTFTVDKHLPLLTGDYSWQVSIDGGATWTPAWKFHVQ